MGSAIDFVLHLDDHLKEMVLQFGPWTYGILFLIVFSETGFIVTPFLPGDSLLFTAGVIAGQNIGLNIVALYFLFIVAALTGDNVNYTIGKFLGHKLFRNPKSKVFKRENLEKTHAFMEKHGPKAIIIARFTPIVRTFVPFAAGMGTMTYGKFLVWSVAGAFIWVTVCLLLGYFFGAIPVVKNNFGIVMLGLVALSILPIVIEVIKHKKALKSAVAPAEKAAN